MTTNSAVTGFLNFSIALMLCLVVSFDLSAEDAVSSSDEKPAASSAPEADAKKTPEPKEEDKEIQEIEEAIVDDMMIVVLK